MRLLEVFADGAGFVLAFELMLGDLGEMLRDALRPLTRAHVKTYMTMLLSGVAFLHRYNIMHRVSSFLYLSKQNNKKTSSQKVNSCIGIMLHFIER